jgi:NADPH2 dehydrogenase
VHAKGSFIYLQLWALGRAAHPSQLVSEDPSLPYVSASDVPLGGRTDGILPRPLSVPEIKEYIELYATAASNAVHRAGFDGVEVHGANGYLVDQFLQDVTNVRTDEYGGSPENRTRFAVEIVDAVVRRVGESKTGIRLSPFGSVNGEILIFLLTQYWFLTCCILYPGMGMKDPKPTFSHLITQLKALHPGLSYIHVVEPRVSSDGVTSRPTKDSNDFIRHIWVGDVDGTDSYDNEDSTLNGNKKRRVLISAGGYTRELGMEYADTKGDLIVYGRPFIANVRLFFVDLSLYPSFF